MFQFIAREKSPVRREETELEKMMKKRRQRADNMVKEIPEKPKDETNIGLPQTLLKNKEHGHVNYHDLKPEEPKIPVKQVTNVENNKEVTSEGSYKVSKEAEQANTVKNPTESNDIPSNISKQDNLTEAVNMSTLDEKDKKENINITDIAGGQANIDNQLAKMMKIQKQKTEFGTEIGSQSGISSANHGKTQTLDDQPVNVKKANIMKRPDLEPQGESELDKRMRKQRERSDASKKATVEPENRNEVNVTSSKTLANQVPNIVVRPAKPQIGMKPDRKVVSNPSSNIDVPEWRRVNLKPAPMQMTKSQADKKKIVSKNTQHQKPSWARQNGEVKYFENILNKTGVINDPLGQPTVLAGSKDFFWSILKCVDGRTGNMCEHSDHYRPELWSAS